MFYYDNIFIHNTAQRNMSVSLYQLDAAQDEQN